MAMMSMSMRGHHHVHASAASPRSSARASTSNASFAMCGGATHKSTQVRRAAVHLRPARLDVMCGASAARKGSRGYKVLETVPKEVISQFVQPNLGPDLANTTYYPKGLDTGKGNKQWYIVDAEGQTLGRLASMVARYIRGFNESTYHPAMDMGSMVVVVNAEKVVVSGKKNVQKLYRRVNVGKPGSMKTERFVDLQKRIPERVVEKAVWGMLPKGRLGRKIFHNMKVYKGASHPHEAQSPIDITGFINDKRDARIELAE